MAKDKGVTVSFRVDRHLAGVLNDIPDKSSFIRDVILRSYYATCPACRGRGVLPDEISRWVDRQMKAAGTIECHCCLYAYPKAARPARPRGESREGFVCPHCQSHGHGH